MQICQGQNQALLSVFKKLCLATLISCFIPIGLHVSWHHYQFDPVVLQVSSGIDDNPRLMYNLFHTYVINQHMHICIYVQSQIIIIIIIIFFFFHQHVLVTSVTIIRVSHNNVMPLRV